MQQLHCLDPGEPPWGINPGATIQEGLSFPETQPHLGRDEATPKCSSSTALIQGSLPGESIQEPPFRRG